MMKHQLLVAALAFICSSTWGAKAETIGCPCEFDSLTITVPYPNPPGSILAQLTIVQNGDTWNVTPEGNFRVVSEVKRPEQYNGSFTTISEEFGFSVDLGGFGLGTK